MKQRYRRLSDVLRERYKMRVRKVSIKAGFTCPNRDGRVGIGGCIYCSDGSLTPSTYDPMDSVTEQLQKGIAHACRKKKARGFIAYFQSNTNTYLPGVWEGKNGDRAVGRLEGLLRAAAGVPGIVELAVGTRPDCVQDPILDMLRRVHNDVPLWVEFGLQSIHNRTLRLINRCHTFEDFQSAVYRTGIRGIRVVVHIILGLPGETRDDMIQTARVLSWLPISGIKIHSLHAVKGTALEKWHADGRWSPLTLNDYVSRVVDVLEVLPPKMIIHRLTAESPRHLIVAPGWCADKQRVLRRIWDELEKRDTWQGREYIGPH